MFLSRHNNYSIIFCRDSSVSSVSDAATNSNVVLPTVSSSSSQFVMSPSTPASVLGSSTNASVLNCKPSYVQVTVSTAVCAGVTISFHIRSRFKDWRMWFRL
ncbi:Uncharacterised protein g10313 [Pycnogonum litorale]